MNRAILIVICDFLVSAMLTMMTGMVPGHSGGTGVGLDESTTRVLLEELTRHQMELEVLRLRLRRAFERSGVETLTPEQEAELRRIAEELAANLARQEQLSARLGVTLPEDQTEAVELRMRLEEAENLRRQLEARLQSANEALAGQQQELADVSGRLRDQERQSAALSRDMSRTRQALADTARDLSAAQQQLVTETREHGETRVQLADSEARRRAAEERAQRSDERAERSEERASQAERREADTRTQLADSEARRQAAEERAQRSDERADRSEERASQAERREADTRTQLADSEARRRAAEERAQRSDERAERSEERADRSESRASQAESRASEAERREADTRTRLVASEADLRNTRRDLQNARTGEREASAESARLRSERDAARVSQARAEGGREVSEVSNAELRDQLNRLQRELLVERLKRQDAETQRAMMQEAVQAAVREASEARQAQAASAEEAARLQGALDAGGSGGNAPAAVPAENRVFERYAGALVRVYSCVSEKKLLGERTGETVSFYPVVDFGNGRIMIVGALNRFAGDWDSALKFDDVTKVQMTYALPFGDGSNSPKLISSRMLVSGQLFHLAGFEYSEGLVQPLKVLDAATLQQRGVEDLFLFKCGSFDANTRLTGRVSLIMSENNPALFIRNIGRAGMSLEQGDIIMSIQGEFVGIVSGRVKMDGAEGVFVPLVRDVAQLWEQAVAIPLSKNPHEEFYSGFGAGMRDLRFNRGIPAGYNRNRYL